MSEFQEVASCFSSQLYIYIKHPQLNISHTSAVLSGWNSGVLDVS